MLRPKQANNGLSFHSSIGVAICTPKKKYKKKTIRKQMVMAIAIHLSPKHHHKVGETTKWRWGFH